MVGFEEELSRKAYPAWRHAYINYRELKHQLAIMARFNNEQADPADTQKWLKLMFQRSLDSEIKTFLDFFYYRLDELTKTIYELNDAEETIVIPVTKRADLTPEAKLVTVQQHLEGWKSAARIMKHLLLFVSLNMRALRKIVKKQAKMVGTLPPESDVELQSLLVVVHPDDPNDVNKQGSFLSAGDVARLQGIEGHPKLKQARHQVDMNLHQSFKLANHLRSEVPAEAGVGSRSLTRHTIAQVEARAAEAAATAALHSPARAAQSWSTTAGLRDSLLSHGTTSTTRRGAVQRLGTFRYPDDDTAFMLEIDDALKQVERNMSLVYPLENVFASMGGFFGYEEPKSLTATTLGLAINLINVLLYMTNYNVVIPLLDDFCLKLGIPPSASGPIIGCADIMALFAAVGFSKWTVHSFRTPLLFSCLVCIAGNAVMAVSYDYYGVPLLILGRLLTGAGNARALNRRYITDFVSMRDRTRAVLGFVAASSGGMALGPFVIVPMSMLFPAPHVGDPVKYLGFTINAVTCSCWFMVASWVLFFLLAVFAYKEPKQPETELQPNPLPDERVYGDPDVQDEVLEPLMEDPGTEPDEGGGERLAPARVPRPLIDLTDVKPVQEEGIEEDRDGLHDVNVDDDENDDELVAEKAAEHPCCSPHVIGPITCLAMLFLLKLLQQGAVSSVPLYTDKFYSWSNGEIGYFLSLVSLLMIPLNYSFGGFSAMISDRVLMGVSVVLCGVGCLCMLSVGGTVAVDKVDFIVGFVLVLAFTNLLEAVSTSLLSKVIHPDMQKGTFNAGLLSTQFGSFGRLLGNFSIAVFSAYASTTQDAIVNAVRTCDAMYGTFFITAVACALLFVGSYGVLNKTKTV